MKFLKFFATFTKINKSANVEDVFANFFVNMSKEKISKLELLTRGQNNNK